jgi:SAM-dependent methyltransferase
MMPDLARIYDAAFFKEWGPGNDAYVRSAEIISDELCRQLRPRRIVDIGCGSGVYSHLFSRRGVETLSIDGVTPPPDQSFPVLIHQRDLTERLENIWGAFDLVLCLEVAEHIPEPLSGAFLDNLTRFGDTLVLSAAPPNQGGLHHVNEQPKRYWVRRLAERGFSYSRPRTGLLAGAFHARRPPYMWMASQISVYERTPGGGRPPYWLPFSVRLPGMGGSGRPRRPCAPPPPKGLLVCCEEDVEERIIPVAKKKTKDKKDI